MEMIRVESEELELKKTYLYYYNNPALYNLDLAVK